MSTKYSKDKPETKASRKRARADSMNGSHPPSKRRKHGKKHSNKPKQEPKDNLDDKTSKINKNDVLLSNYTQSSEMQRMREQILLKGHREYMNKKKEAHNKISTILNSMTPKQEQRYECWNRSVIPKKIVKSIMNKTLNANSGSTSKKKSNIDDKSVIVMQALSKCLVMELVAKSREIQKETIDNYLTQQNNKKQQQMDIEQTSHKKEEEEILYPPDPIIEDDEGDDNEENKESKNKEDDMNNGNSNSKEEMEENVLNDKEENDDGNDSETELNEEFVLGPIRPTHIREALRRLQRDRGSFFHTKDSLFGSSPN